MLTLCSLLIMFKHRERGETKVQNQSNFPPQTKFHSHLKSQSPCQFPADLRQNSWPFVDKEFRTKGQRFVNAQHINNLKTLIKN
ncbi:hypothetical protein L2E82_25977 [Cichorium intybus]|uniref:Uncharacterized protein n=1 Tax=Cichorium intybus TaxID=13427 RepID=A0ACB9E616_CICIN|nr:hypothetical protein L2E82_25977 [Cichorium intybus]